MGCKTRDVFNEDGTTSSSSGAAVREALLFTTMCIVGLPVEVQVKDGSIYSGIVHTACFDKDYGIILKRAKMTKKGKEKTYVANEGVVDTLVVSSCDLVQVVAKGILLPSEGIVSNAHNEDVGAILGSSQSLECLENELRTLGSSKTAPKPFTKGRKPLRQSRSSGQNESKLVIGLPSNVEKGKSKGDLPKSLESALEDVNGNVDSRPSTQIDEATTQPVAAVEGQAGKDQSEGKEYEPFQNSWSPEVNAIHEAQLSSSDAKSSLPQLQSVNSVHADVSKTSSNGPSGSSMDVQSSSIEGPNVSLLTSQSGAQMPSNASNESVSNTNSKEFKLNPGAKTFMPMFTITKSGAPTATTTAANMALISSNPSVLPAAVTPPNNGINTFASRSSLPTKFLPTNNLVAITGDSASQHTQQIVGHVGSRLQSLRYTSQYNTVQVGPAYIHPNSQAVMVGRLGQLVYMQPISHELIQGSTVPAPISLRPQLTPQVLLPKHEGNIAPQALQPGFVATGQHPYGIQFPQPSFPPVRPISVSGAHDYLNTKLL